jgi:hypothetical protein
MKYLIMCLSVLASSVAGQDKPNDPAKVYSVCEVLEQLPSLDRKMIRVEGALFGSSHGTFLFGQCERKLVVNGYTWPNMIWIESPDERRPFQRDFDAYEDVQRSLKRLRPSKNDEVVVTFLGMLETDDLTRRSGVDGSGRSVGIGFGPQNIAPAQLVVKTEMNPRVIRKRK